MALIETKIVRKRVRVEEGDSDLQQGREKRTRVYRSYRAFVPFARNADGSKRYLAVDEIPESEDLFCIECKRPLFIRRPVRKAWHFAHKPIRRKRQDEDKNEDHSNGDQEEPDEDEEDSHQCANNEPLHYTAALEFIKRYWQRLRLQRRCNCGIDVTQNVDLRTFLSTTSSSVTVTINHRSWSSDDETHPDISIYDDATEQLKIAIFLSTRCTKISHDDLQARGVEVIHLHHREFGAWSSQHPQQWPDVFHVTDKMYFHACQVCQDMKDVTVNYEHYAIPSKCITDEHKLKAHILSRRRFNFGGHAIDSAELCRDYESFKEHGLSFARFLCKSGLVPWCKTNLGRKIKFPDETPNTAFCNLEWEHAAGLTILEKEQFSMWCQEEMSLLASALKVGKSTAHLVLLYVPLLEWALKCKCPFATLTIRQLLQNDNDIRIHVKRLLHSSLYSIYLSSANIDHAMAALVFHRHQDAIPWSKRQLRGTPFPDVISDKLDQNSVTFMMDWLFDDAKQGRQIFDSIFTKWMMEFQMSEYFLPLIEFWLSNHAESLNLTLEQLQEQVQPNMTFIPPIRWQRAQELFRYYLSE